jgi:transcriptional regulator GlxA family with amidase domain
MLVIAAKGHRAYGCRMATRRIAILVYDGVQSLDVTGPLEVFAGASVYRRERDPSAPPPYRVELIARNAGIVTSGSGLRIDVPRGYRDARGLDTLIVAGGEARAVTAAAGDRKLLRWLVAAGARVRRLASVCSGAFLLAEAGLLDGRRATTHWFGTDQLARRYPRITVVPDAIYVRDGQIYTSAGVTAGIDLALALVEEDLGHAIALEVARRRVVFLKRPGGQSQFSSHLAAQTTPPGPLGDLPEWIVANLGVDLSVEALAARAAMSPRNFARVFHRETGLTPAKYVERARVDAARRCLEDSALGLEQVASRCGFASAEHLRRTFHRHLRIVPIDYRKHFHRQPAVVPLRAVGGGRTA